MEVVWIGVHQKQSVGTMKDKIEVLKEVQQELSRFQKKLSAAIEEQKVVPQWSSRHYAAAKRGALDLKNELTKLTQDSKYRYSR